MNLLDGWKKVLATVGGGGIALPLMDGPWWKVLGTAAIFCMYLYVQGQLDLEKLKKTESK